MNIKIDKLQLLHILTEAVGHNDLANLQGGMSEPNYRPVFNDGRLIQYEAARRSRDFMEFTTGGRYYDIPVYRCDIIVTREDESHYRFSEIGRVPRATQSALIVLLFNNDTSDAILALSDSVQFGIRNATYSTFDATIKRCDPTGVIFETIHLRRCRITSIETEEGYEVKFIIRPEAIFYVL